MRPTNAPGILPVHSAGLHLIRDGGPFTLHDGVGSVLNAGTPPRRQSIDPDADPRANLIVVHAAREWTEQMYTLEIDKAYSTNFARFRSSLAELSYFQFKIDMAYEGSATGER